MNLSLFRNSQKILMCSSINIIDGLAKLTQNIISGNSSIQSHTVELNFIYLGWFNGFEVQ